MEYEAGNCAIVISMKRAFKINDAPKCFFFLIVGFISDNRTQPKATIINGFFMIMGHFNLQQNGIHYHLNAPFMLITMVQIPPSYLILSPRYLTKYIQTTQHLT